MGFVLLLAHHGPIPVCRSGPLRAHAIGWMQPDCGAGAPVVHEVADNTDDNRRRRAVHYARSSIGAARRYGRTQWGGVKR